MLIIIIFKHLLLGELLTEGRRKKRRSRWGDSAAAEATAVPAPVPQIAPPQLNLTATAGVSQVAVPGITPTQQLGATGVATTQPLAVPPAVSPVQLGSASMIPNPQLGSPGVIINPQLGAPGVVPNPQLGAPGVVPNPHLGAAGTGVPTIGGKDELIGVVNQ